MKTLSWEALHLLSSAPFASVPPMDASAEQLFLQALSLSPETRAELTERLVASSEEAIDSGIERAHLEEIRRRMAQLDSGEVEAVPGEVVMARARGVLAATGASDRAG